MEQSEGSKTGEVTCGLPLLQANYRSKKDIIGLSEGKTVVGPSVGDDQAFSRSNVDDESSVISIYCGADQDF